ncbi:hypothetical protein FNF31_01418 [Cafeteria roenbergensis]|uniref:Calcium uniporter protein C-terminal domain-containing protein n=1 Tax=Cafeteria roenbergensis TaxID=33653 RepID=A0A5A8DLF0_CAFRO|nr:hypothetical protein FNF31_01418 [Cafeteria roenbergensis]
MLRRARTSCDRVIRALPLPSPLVPARSSSQLADQQDAAVERRALHVNARGQVVLRLRVKPGDSEDISFPLGVDTTVASALELLRAEPGLEGAEVALDDGTPADRLGTIGDLASGGFLVRLGNHRTIRLSPLPWVPTRSDTQGGVLTLEEVVRRGSYLRVTKAVRARPERTIRVAEFLNLAADAGVPPDEGRDLLRGLHRAGVLLHFHRHPDPHLRDVVFLKPEEALDALYGHFGLEGPNKAFVREQRQRKQAELAGHRARLADRRAARALVEREAGAWALWSNRFGFASMAAGVGVYAWLAFDYLSWDIMEPVTYATGAVASVGAYWWWVLADRELGFSSFADTVMRWRRRSLYRGTELARLEARVAAEEAEVELLARTEFNPSLLQYYDAVESVTALPGTANLRPGKTASADEEEAVRRAASLVRLVTAAAEKHSRGGRGVAADGSGDPAVRQ